MSHQYDELAHNFVTIKELPITTYSEKYTFFQMVGNVMGKSVLDLGCGTGLYTRQIKQKGAAYVVGVDISANMLEKAIKQEKEEPLGIEYICRDVSELGEIGQFDFVVATFLLCNAQTEEQIFKMARSIYTNLKSGSRFVSIDENVAQSPDSYSICEKYGYTKVPKEKNIICTSEPLPDGTTLVYIFTVPGSSQRVALEAYCLSRATYKKAFLTAGFKEFH